MSAFFPMSAIEDAFFKTSIIPPNACSSPTLFENVLYGFKNISTYSVSNTSDNNSINFNVSVSCLTSSFVLNMNDTLVRFSSFS
jgi:hypothetical protein